MDCELKLQDEITNLEYTIDELQKLSTEKKEERSVHYYRMFLFPVDKDYKINYLKRDLALSTLTHEIVEIDKMIALQKKETNKCRKYLLNNMEKNQIHDDIIDVAAIAADAVIH